MKLLTHNICLKCMDYYYYYYNFLFIHCDQKASGSGNLNYFVKFRYFFSCKLLDIVSNFNFFYRMHFVCGHCFMVYGVVANDCCLLKF